MGSFDGRTLSDSHENILQLLAKQEDGFNGLMKRTTISNHPLRRILRELEAEGYIRKLQRKEPQQHSGHPVEPYSLTEKAKQYFRVIEEVRTLRARLLHEVVTERITRMDQHQTLQSEYKRLGVTPPTWQETLRSGLEELSQQIQKLGPNTIMLVKTYDERSLDVADVKVFDVLPYRLRTQGKGPLTCYLIEPIAERYTEGLRREIERNKIALLKPLM